MIPNADVDAASDAALLSVLRLVVARRKRKGGGETEDGAFDGVLTLEGLATIESIVAQARDVSRLVAGSDDERQGILATYEEHRRVLDPLWRYVEAFGISDLLSEARERLADAEQGEERVQRPTA